MTTLNLSILEAAIGAPPPWIVGILNVTPNSFSDGGKFLSPEAAIKQAYRLRKEGAHIIDIGGVSTGFGTNPVTALVEIERVSPVVRALSSSMFVSIDTYNAQTARRALELGAKMVNDVSALRADPLMAQTICEFKAFAVLMFSKEQADFAHVTSTPKEYQELIPEIAEFLKSRIDFALSQGLTKEQLILDPGMGKFISLDDNRSWELIRDFKKLTANIPNLPLMVGTSRKGFLGGQLEERDPASALTATILSQKGAHLIRTHNPRLTKEFLTITKTCQ